MNGTPGKLRLETQEEAKRVAFETIENGSAATYLTKRDERLEAPENKN
jgi:hypothetical protein